MSRSWSFLFLPTVDRSELAHGVGVALRRPNENRGVGCFAHRKHRSSMRRYLFSQAECPEVSLDQTLNEWKYHKRRGSVSFIAMSPELRTGHGP